MKKLMMIVFAVVVSSYSCDMLCMDKLRHIEQTLDRIAALMEKQERNQIQERVKVRENIPPKTYESRTNGRSLRAVPSDPTLFDEVLIDESCEETCKSTHYIKSDIDKCIEILCKEK